MPTPFRLAAVVAVLGTAPLFAQSIATFAPVADSLPSDAKPPTVKWRQKPDYPEQLKKTQEIGYALFQVHQVPTGEIVYENAQANALPILDSLYGNIGSVWYLKPATEGTTPIETRSFFGLVYTPKPTPGPGYDRLPTLELPFPINVKGRPNDPRNMIMRATLSVDETGAVTDAVLTQGEDEYFQKPVHDGTARWKFAPATLGGKPVDAKFEMAVVVSLNEPSGEKKRHDYAPPRVLSQTRPEYPMAMRRAGIDGKVMVDFVVGKDGKVTNAYIHASTAPWFDGPALDAVRKWTFDPAKRDGERINAHMEVPIMFQLNGGGRPAYGIDGDNGKGTFTAQVESVLAPMFPYDPLLRHENGTATVRMLVTRNGEVGKLLVTQTSAPEFGQALAAAAVGFTFVPAFKDGKPVESVVEYKETFDEYDMVNSDSESALRLVTKSPEKVVQARDLDKPLVPISRRPPVSPPGLAKDEAVLLEFYIDDNGKAQLAHPTKGENDLCAYAAMQAVDGWLFETPTRNGKPVFTKVTVPFLFKAAGGAPPPSGS